MAEKPTFRERIRSLTAPPTLEGRLWNSLGDGLIAVAAYQFGKYLNNLAGDKLNHAGPLFNQATDMLYSNQHLSSEQLVQVTALHNQVQIIFNQVKVLDFASEVTLGVFILASAVLFYNAVRVGIQLAKDNEFKI